MSTESQRICPSCGNEFSGAMEFCPVCMLRGAFVGGVESGEPPASEDIVRPTQEEAAQRFEHYELVTGDGGKPIELGGDAPQKEMDNPAIFLEKKSLRRGSPRRYAV